MPTLDQTAGMLLILSVLAYLAAGTLLAARCRVTGRILFGIGWGCNALTVLFNWLACGHPPFGSMYHVLSALSLCFFPVYLFLHFRRGLAWMCTAFAFTSAVPLIGPLFMERDMFWRRMPALQSPWFVPHILSYLIAYTLASVSFILVLRGLHAVRRGNLRSRQFEDGVDALTRLAFPFMTFGLLSGALSAENAWGRFWSWDAKEIWALIMWLFYALYFHCRRSTVCSRWAPVCQIAGFIALIVTFLCVSLIPRLGSVLHAYM